MRALSDTGQAGSTDLNAFIVLIHDDTNLSEYFTT